MVDQFLEEIVEDMSGRKIVRVKILLLMDTNEREDFEGAVEGFYKASELMYWREDVVFGEVKSIKLLKEIYYKYGNSFFPGDYDLNSIIVWRNYNRFEYKSHKEGVVIKMDMEKMGGKGKDSFGRWIAENSIALVEEMNSLNQHAFSNRIPMLIAFVDPLKSSVTQNFLDQYKKLAEYFKRKIQFVWVDFNDNLGLMRRLGVHKNCK